MVIDIKSIITIETGGATAWYSLNKSFRSSKLLQFAIGIHEPSSTSAAPEARIERDLKSFLAVCVSQTAEPTDRINTL